MITRRYRLTLFNPSSLILMIILILIGGYVGWKLGVNEGWIAFGLGFLPLMFVSGSQVDVEQKRLRSFVSFLALKMGKWYSFEELPELVLLSKKRAFGMASNYQPGIGRLMRMAPFLATRDASEYYSENDKHFVYELYAMDLVHEGRIMIGRAYQKDKAELMTKTMSAITHLPWVSFSPGARFPKKRLGVESP